MRLSRQILVIITMTNDDISKELWEACWINSKTFDQYVDKLKNNPSDTSALISGGKAYLIIGRYKEACEDLTGLIRSLIKEGEEDLTGLVRLLIKEKEDLTDLIRSRIEKDDLTDLIRLLMKEDDDDEKGEDLISSLIRWRTKKEDSDLIRLPIKEDKKKKQKRKRMMIMRRRKKKW
ncbi:hypothetical protein C2G38_1235231 [Gigaspora rosea]|uniref:Tetratricopeptide repeat protein n=1 Tax=Gigaspora rosea TaxID=44941 RepID=A0A397VBP2_9GLOM|nr:hypothetical protein C2G38_1235231 [Gigaspora rosea]